MLQAQTKTSGSICDDDDCSPVIFNIDLNTTGADNSQRTEDFKKAYLELKAIKSTHNQAWQAKYTGFQLGGATCLRYYQLESYLTHEYHKNPDFKTFIDKQESNIEFFKERGFQSSRRTMNLIQRLKNRCEGEMKKVEDMPNSSLGDLLNIYMELGRQQGYFDENGQQIKQFKDETTSNNTTAQVQGSKKE